MNETMMIDVGTGTVIGILARESDGEELRILAREEVRQPDGVVREGRIVDVERAATVVEDVAGRLNEQAEIQVKSSHYAVPGRGLESNRRQETREWDSPRRITEADVHSLTSARSRRTPKRVEIDVERLSVEVDGEPVESAVGQFGTSLSMEWLTTTIPIREIENKRTVIEKAGLVPDQVLLEPRAALRASVDPSQFTVPMAVVDFGAGTTDAAYLEDGRVTAFETFLGGGDAISRRIQRDCRVTRSTAERLKEAVERERIEFDTIRGDRNTIDRDELERLILPELKNQIGELRDWFADHPPELVFVAGGGSQFPFLERLIARLLDMDVEDVVSGPPSLPDHCIDEAELIRSPADHTALGGLLLASEHRSRRYLRFTLDGEVEARLVVESPTAEDLVDQLGYKPREPDPDSAMMVSIDGEWETIRSDRRLEPQVLVDGEEVASDYEIRSGDDVEVLPPEDPEPIQSTASDWLPGEVLSVEIDGHRIELNPYLETIEEDRVDPNQTLEDGEEYRLVDRFDAEDVRSRAVEEGISWPDAPLWKVDATFESATAWTVGTVVEVFHGLDVDAVGLGALNDQPPSGEPLRTPLD